MFLFRQMFYLFAKGGRIFTAETRRRAFAKMQIILPKSKQFARARAAPAL